MADQALALVKANGAAGNATCAITTSRILQALGLQQMSPSYFPVQVMEDFAKLPGVSERKIFDDSPDSNSDVLRYLAQQAAKAAAAG